MLLDPRVRIGPADEGSFTVEVTDGGRTVGARVIVDERGAPVDFETDDRFVQIGGAWVRAHWHTPIAGWERGEDGRWFPTGGRAAWMLPEGEFTYVELAFRPETLRYDVGPED
jgi:hypothetical protein